MARDIEIQWTEEYARSQSDSYDEDSYDEGSYDQIDWEIGESRETREFDSWQDMPTGYEPVDKSEAEDYYNWLEDNNEED